jgi:hypothetical protein
LRPLAVLMRFAKPCLLVLLRFEGWNVRFILVQIIGRKYSLIF